MRKPILSELGIRNISEWNAKPSVIVEVLKYYIKWKPYSLVRRRNMAKLELAQVWSSSFNYGLRLRGMLNFYSSCLRKLRSKQKLIFTLT
ncbi:hypothetical protein HNY73_015845 [Argiope bruennichi]|uniref:Uncharacterized protein n=1 Tax=Argiope bruennichi TaxID=94029 RepID=A0A8T0EH38_ARGBR|nr:hypothetical protein HNY73_015845 [Argiope bruennichi]